ncbi:MAG: hypothetical protein ABH833_03180 [Parcubacteria group bacterium]
MIKRRIILSFILILSFISCTTPPRKQTYINNESLSGIKKVAVVSSANAPDALFSISARESGQAVQVVAAIFPLFIFPMMVLEPAARHSEDKYHSTTINKNVDLMHIEDRIAQSYVRALNKGGIQIAEYIKDKTQDNRQLIEAGYDAVIRLLVREILISRRPGDYVGLNVVTNCQILRADTGKIILDRDESASSSELHTLDDYKINGLKELNTILDKIANNFAYDFLYLK